MGRKPQTKLQKKVVASVPALEESTRGNESSTTFLPLLDESVAVVAVVPTTPPQLTSTVEAAVAPTVPSPILSPALRRVMASVDWARSERLEEVVFPPQVGTKLWWICFDDLSNTDVRTGADDDINLVRVNITRQGDASNPFSITDVRGVARDCSASEVLAGLDIHNDVVRQFALEGVGDKESEGESSEEDKVGGDHGGVVADGHLLHDDGGDGAGGGAGEGAGEDKGGEDDHGGVEEEKGGDEIGEDGDHGGVAEDKGGEGAGVGAGEGGVEASKEVVGGGQHGGVEQDRSQQGVEVSRATVALLALHSGTGLSNPYTTETTRMDLPPPPSAALCETAFGANLFSVAKAQAILKAAKLKAKQDRKRQREEEDLEVDSVAELQNKLKAANTERKRLKE